MTSFQSSLESIRQRGSNSSWLSLLVALALGLLLGLFIAWIVWPVEWQGAILADLAPETRAEYISAVADSYVYSLATTPNAAESAQVRLTGLGVSKMQEVEAAIRYFQSRPGDAGSMRVINLIQLANGLGLVVDQTAPVIPPVENGGAVVTGPDAENSTSGAQDALASASNDSNEGSSLLSWLLTLVAALLLLGGGFYLLRQFFQSEEGSSGSFGWKGRNQSQERDEDGDSDPFDDELDQPVTQVGVGRNSWVRPLSSQSVAVMQQPAARGPTWELDATQVEEEEPEFDAEEADETSDPPWEPPQVTRTLARTPAEPQQPQIAEPERGDASPSAKDNSYADDNPFDDSPFDHSPFDHNDSEDEEEAEVDTTARPTPVPLAQHRRADDTVSNLYEPRSQPIKLGDAPTARFPGAKYVGNFECTYHAGVDEYDESYPVTDPATQRYIGECGMGVSTKNRILHKNPDEVIALEVWLFDKSDERNISDQMRVLMSEYASDHYADAFIKDRNGDNRPFVAQRGTRFQLEGRSLVLNGEVLDAEYNREGIFQSVKVKLDVLRR